MKLGIIGKGFVGSAVAHGFDKDCEQVIVQLYQITYMNLKKSLI